MTDFSEVSEFKLRRMAERGKAILSTLAILYFGLSGLLLFLRLLSSGVAGFVFGIAKLVPAIILFTFLFFGHNWARIAVGLWALLIATLSMLFLWQSPPTGIASRLVQNLAILFHLGVAAILFFAKSIQANQYVENRKRARKRRRA